MPDVTGPLTSKKAILWIYDIFAFTPQTIQGADILGETYLVIIPDLFHGSAAQKDWYPPTNDSQSAHLNTFLNGAANRKKALSLIPEIVAGSAKIYPSIEKWGAIGFCWGGKIVALTSDKGTNWVASAQSSPAFVEVGDAAKIAIPHIVLASKNENKDDIKGYEERLEHVPHFVKTYDQPHGFQSARYVPHPHYNFIPRHVFLWDVAESLRYKNESARADSICVSFFLFLRSADLDDPESKKAYEEAYVDILNFFQEHFLWGPPAPGNQHTEKKKKKLHSPTTHEVHNLENESYEKLWECEMGAVKGAGRGKGLCFFASLGLTAFDAKLVTYCTICSFFL